MPHYDIKNPNKPGKLRVVFALNDHLLSGPDLLNYLAGVLLQFREGKYPAVSDIEQMFRQINIRPEDHHVLRFLWRDNNTKAIEDHVMRVQVFGKINSPILKKTTRDSEEVVSENIIDQINRNFYMDDFSISHSSIARLSTTAKTITKELSNGCFRLTKRYPNHF